MKEFSWNWKGLQIGEEDILLCPRFDRLQCIRHRFEELSCLWTCREIKKFRGGKSPGPKQLGSGNNWLFGGLSIGEDGGRTA